MKDRRSIARFALEVPARVEILKESGEREILQLRTKNISASGAFLYESTPLDTSMASGCTEVSRGLNFGPRSA